MAIGIRTRVILLAAVATVPLIAVDVYQAKRAQQQGLEAARIEGLRLTRALAAMQEDTLDDTRNLLSGFTAGREGQHRALISTDCNAGMRRLLDANALHVNIVLADPRGELVCAARVLSKSINVADRKYFTDALTSKSFALSDVIVSRDSGNRVLVASYPVLDAEERVLGVLLATVKLEALSRSFERADPPSHVVAYLVDSSARVVALWPHVPEFIGRTLRGAQGESFIRGKEGFADIAGPDGFLRVGAYTRLNLAAGEPLYVVAGVPRDALEREPAVILRGELISIGATLALALALGLAGAQLLVVQPIRKLTAAADRYREGDLSARSGLSHEGAEIGKLAEAFDLLAHKNERITRALKTLSGGNRTLLRERNETELLREMCKVAVEKGGYQAAYVCYPVNDEAKSITVVGRYGEDQGLIDTIPPTWSDSRHGQGTIGRCIRTGERVVVRSIAADARFAPWYAAASKAGFKSVASLPLRVQNALVGTFTLATREENAFDEAEVDLLDEMAADLSFGIEVIRANARRKEAEAIARRALTHDPVIDIPNRSWFVRRVAECLARGMANHEPVAVLDVHLGRLEDIEHSFGYENCNEVLRQVAERLERLPGAEENLGRIPVHDFGIALCSYDAHAAQRTAEAVRELLSEPIRVGEALIDLQTAVGISIFPAHGDDPETLVRRASIAARDSFRKGEPAAVYSGAMARENPARLSLAAELRTAIETRQLVLHFQPKVALADERVVGCEALVRWQHPKRGLVPPLEFIGLAEEIGLIRPLTYQIVDLAVRQLHTWLAAGVKIPMAVNLSARNLYDPLLIQTIDGLFSTWSVPRSLLHFEITEGALVDDPLKAKSTLEALCRQDVDIFVDDFGTGYSSLSYLVSLPVHGLKIDRSFVKQMSRSREARSVVASIISMARKLELRVVAEGVETKDDAATLHDFGCAEAQGYYYSKPLPDAEFRSWLAAR